MRENFEKSLRQHSEIVNQATEAGETAEKIADEAEKERFLLEEISRPVDELTERLAKEQGTSAETELKILQWQVEKQTVMTNLKADLARLDAGGFDELGFTESDFNIETREDFSLRTASFDAVAGRFAYEDDRRGDRLASMGEVLADLDWDIAYNFAAGAKRREVKKYLVEKAKKELRVLLDEQIIDSELGKSEEKVRDGVRLAYESVRETREAGAEFYKTGFLAEKIVRNFLQILDEDNNLPIELEEADVYQDVIQKMDFIVRHKLANHNLGVGVEGGAGADIAIQFSINPEAEAKKREQLARANHNLKRFGGDVDEIALVIFPDIMARELKQAWEKAGRPAGGPINFMAGETKERLFKELLKNTFSTEQLESYWREAEGV